MYVIQLLEILITEVRYSVLNQLAGMDLSSNSFLRRNAGLGLPKTHGYIKELFDTPVDFYLREAFSFFSK